ncbi:MAG: enoyl-CoA hydratase/isomerase family protein [Candidatus Cloacimonetes bacterium]|nr:enoyl-CoA hydratase/isomerase family protein [Candidatus Cloacimonadota bacterium]
MDFYNKDNGLYVYGVDKGDYCEVVFNQEPKKNPFDTNLAKVFPLVIDFLKSSTYKAIVFRGSGETFSSGGDFKFLEDRILDTSQNNIHVMKDFYNSFLKVRELPQLTIALIEGAAIGAGLCFAMACDFRLVQKHAKLALNFVHLGINPGMGAWPLSKALLGESKAKYLLMSGVRFSGEDFYNWGGANHLIDQDTDTDTELKSFVDSFKHSSSFANAMLKNEIIQDESFNKYLDAEALGQSKCFSGEDYKKRLNNALAKISNRKK